MTHPEYPEAWTLTSAFSAVDFDAWRERAERDLQRYDRTLDSLVSSTLEGIDIEPLYHAGSATHLTHADVPPGVFPFVRGTRPPSESVRTRVRTRHTTGTPSELLQDELDRGVDELEISGTVEDPVTMVESGLPISFAPHTDPGLAEVVLSSASNTRPCTLGVDPFADAIRHRRMDGLDDGVAGTARLLSVHDEHAPGGISILEVDARAWHDTGSDRVQDLGFGLAALVEHVRVAAEHGVAPERVLARAVLRISLDAAFFMSIARLRAVRLLWARVAEVLDVDEASLAARCRVIAEPSARDLTKYDPWVNALRNTAAAFAALVGDADVYVPAPHNARVGVDDRGRRLARNTPIILAAESHLARAVDPAGGSWFVESLTQSVAARAWGVFQAVESAGGLREALRDGMPFERVEAAASARRERVARRKRPITGVTEYPSLDLASVDEAGPASAWLPNGTDPVAAPFEALRDRADAIRRRHGHWPRAQLVNLGTLAEHTARTTFMRNLLAAGGFDAVETPSLTDEADLDALEEGGVPSSLADDDAATPAPCPVAVLCGPDARYSSLGPAAVERLRGRFEHVVVAGRLEKTHPDLAQRLTSAGVTDYAYLGCDVLALLERLHAAMEDDR